MRNRDLYAVMTPEAAKLYPDSASSKKLSVLVLKKIIKLSDGEEIEKIKSIRVFYFSSLFRIMPWKDIDFYTDRE